MCFFFQSVLTYFYTCMIPADLKKNVVKANIGNSKFYQSTKSSSQQSQSQQFLILLSSIKPAARNFPITMSRMASATVCFDRPAPSAYPLARAPRPHTKPSPESNVNFQKSNSYNSKLVRSFRDSLLFYSASLASQ